MSTNRSTLSYVTFLFLASSAAFAQTTPRLPKRINEAQTLRLKGTTHPLARPESETGRADGALRMDRMLLVLQSSPAQQTELAALIQDQQDPSSPRFHQWLTPQQFASEFGVAPADVATVTAWLQSKGFEVGPLAAGGRSLEFSGSAAQVESAFSTEMRHYTVGGVKHVANAKDLAIPADLSGVVAGIASLNDFHAAPMHSAPVSLSTKSTLATSTTTANAHPMLTTSTGNHALAPGDFATIYNVGSLYNASLDGTGQTIAVVGRTNFKMSDVTTFRATFGLPVNNPQIVLNGTNPGIISQNEEVEALLDTEWSGAVAKNATIKFVLSASTNTTGGDTLSSQYIVNNNLAPVMTTSFGLCEAQLGSQNQFYNSLWQQAAAQGISVLAAAGDSGSAGCDAPSSTSPASQGFGISGIASTPYNTALGGTQLNDSASPSSYWSPTNTSTDSSALSYIPELVWNDSAYVAAGSSSNNLYAGAGGVSTLYATPSWQTGAGVPSVDPNTTNQHHRYIPDVSLSAAGHDPYVVVLNGGMIGVSGTSASAPAFAGIMALVNQHLGTSVGNPATTLYSMNAQYPSAFHDVVGGNNAVPCTVGSAHCTATSSSIGTMAGWSAGAGYDLATGLGSVNAYNLVMNWPQPAKTAAVSISSLSPNPMTGSAVSQILTIKGTGFQSGAKVLITSKSGVTTYTQTTLTGTTQIQLSVVTGVAAASWSVQVVNPNSQASNTVTLTINAPATTPAISSLSPNPMTASASPQTLTINGSGFQSGSGLQVLFTANGSTTTIPSTSITFVSSLQLQVSINTGPTAQTWSVQVVNPGGLTSNSVTLTVKTGVSSAPAITSLSPATLKRLNGYQLLIVNGSGFQSGPGLQLTVGYPGGSTTIPYNSMYFISSAQLQLYLNVGTTARTLTVSVTDPNGLSSNTVNLPVQ